MRDYGPSATPRAYAVWYTYVSGEQPLMNDAIKRLTALNAGLSPSDIDDLHETYLGSSRYAAAAGETGATMLAEIEGIMEMLSLSPRDEAGGDVGNDARLLLARGGPGQSDADERHGAYASSLVASAAGSSSNQCARAAHDDLVALLVGQTIFAEHAGAILAAGFALGRVLIAAALFLALLLHQFVRREIGEIVKRLDAPPCRA